MSLAEESIEVLEKNWKGKFTIPSSRLYPFQWNWDSGFIALGNSLVAPEKAIIELETLFEGQWSNGFLPHILFHNAEKYASYFPSANFWDSTISKYAPKHLHTSGITQPPIHGFVLLELLRRGADKNRIKSLVKKTINYHNYLYNYREYKDTGLVVIWHNWESGMDNSPWWDDTLATIKEEKIEKINLDRKDIHEVEDAIATRPKNLDYKRYLYLINLLKSSKYDEVTENYPFQIIDPVFNAILHKSNISLIELGEKLNLDIGLLKEKAAELKSHFDTHLWNSSKNLYFPLDIILGRQIKIQCSGSFVPIFAEIPNEKKINYLVNKLEWNEEYVLIPSCFPSEAGFEQKNYWRGPVWVNINWMVWQGLKGSRYHSLAERIKKETIEMVIKYGIYEYFEPYKNANIERGIGGAQFSWSAALILDMLKTN